MEAKHTPGPWKAEDQTKTWNGKEGDWRWGWRVSTSPANIHLAQVGNVDAFHKAQAGANARLIAAAPDLLAALSRVREAWGDQIRDATEIDCADLVDWLVSWYNLEVMPALRKAEGEG